MTLICEYFVTSFLTLCFFY